MEAWREITAKVKVLDVAVPKEDDLKKKWRNLKSGILKLNVTPDKKNLGGVLPTKQPPYGDVIGLYIKLYHCQQALMVSFHI